MQEAIDDPPVPYIGEVKGGIFPGKMVKIQGKTPEYAVRFAINYQLGPTLNPRDDVAIHFAPRFNEGFMTRNHIQSMNWGPEENGGPLLIHPGTNFEVIILCLHDCYKIAVNGRHFTEFKHRIPYQRVTHLVVDGDVDLTSIFYEVIPVGPPSNSSAPEMDVGPPVPGGIYPTIGPHEPHPPPHYQPPPPPPSGYGEHPRPQNFGNRQESEEDPFFMDKVGLAIGGMVAAGGLAAAMHAYKKNQQQQKSHAGEVESERSDASKSESGFGGLGSLGAAIASSLAANHHAQQGYPSQPGGMLGSLIYALGDSHGQGQGQPKDPLAGVLGSLLSGGGGGGGGGGQPRDPLAGALGSLLSGGGGGRSSQGRDPLAGALGSLLSGGGGGGSLLDSFFGGGGGGGGRNHQPDYHPSGGYGGHQPSGGYEPSGGYSSHQGGGGGGNDFLKGIGGALFKSALDGLSKNTSHNEHPNAGHFNPSYGPSHPPQRPPSPPPPGKGKLSAAEISKGLGFGDDDE